MRTQNIHLAIKRSLFCLMQDENQIGVEQEVRQYMERKCIELKKSGYKWEMGDTELILSREALFFFFVKNGRNRNICLLAEEEGIKRERLKVKSWLFSGSEIW